MKTIQSCETAKEVIEILKSKKTPAGVYVCSNAEGLHFSGEGSDTFAIDYSIKEENLLDACLEALGLPPLHRT